MVPSAAAAPACRASTSPGEPNQVRQQIGIVFQARSLDPKLTVAENLKHQGHLYGLHGALLRTRIQEVLTPRRPARSRRAISSKPSPAACSGASNLPRA